MNIVLYVEEGKEHICMTISKMTKNQNKYLFLLGGGRMKNENWANGGLFMTCLSILFKV